MEHVRRLFLKVVLEETRLEQSLVHLYLLGFELGSEGSVVDLVLNRAARLVKLAAR